MVVPSASQLQAFAGGQMTDLPVFDGTFFVGSELLEIVSPGNAEEGINYSITTGLFGFILGNLLAGQVVIGQGQYTSSLSPYSVPANIGRVFVNKTIAEPTYIKLALAAGYLGEPLVADVAGTVDESGNAIFVTFTGGETADALSHVDITTPFGGYFFRPVRSLNRWHLGTG